MSNRTQYENDLAALKTALTEMGQSAADAVEAAMEALCTADAEAAAAVAQGDGRINNMERDIEHRCMTLLLRQQPGGSYRISVRTAKGVDACAIARRLGGGGHTRAAGCELLGNLDNAKSAILSEVEAVLDAPQEEA